MKFGVITQHNKDSCSDKIEPRQLVWHIEATFSWQRPSEIWKEKRRAYLNIWFYFILLSKGFRIGGEKRGGGRLLLDEREREWLLQWLKSEKNQICFPCMHAAAAKEQNSPPPTAATTTSLLSRTPHHRHRPPSHRHTKASYLQRRPSPLMTASLHSTDHSALKPFFFGGEDICAFYALSWPNDITESYWFQTYLWNRRRKEFLIFWALKGELERGCQKFHSWNISPSNRSDTSFIPPSTSSLDIITDLTMVDR